MANWTTSNMAASTLWTTLYSMQQLVTSFEESGTLTMIDLTFFNELSSGEQAKTAAQMVADQLDSTFINGRGAQYEAGVTNSDAMSSIVAILVDKTKQVQDLATTVDGLYKFWGE